MFWGGSKGNIYSVHPLPFLLGGRDGGLTFNQIFKEGGDLARPQLLEGVAVFRVGCNFYMKNKIKMLNIFLFHD